MLTSADQRDEPETPLTEGDVFHLWTIVRDAGERLVQQCIDHQQTGVELNPLRLLMLPDAWYGIDIRSEDQISRSSSILKAEQRSSMQERDLSGGTYHRQFIMANRFKTTFSNIV